MIVDSHTLADLEIFGAPGRPGLFDLLDRTRTRAGREALKARFLGYSNYCRGYRSRTPEHARYARSPCSSRSRNDSSLS